MVDASNISASRKGGVRRGLRGLLSRQWSMKSEQCFNEESTISKACPISKPNIVRQQSHDSEMTEDDTESSVSSTFTSFHSSDGRASSLRVKTQDESLLCTYPKTGASTSSIRKCTSIGFSNVTNHFHTLVMGDHPEVQRGVPVALGDWESSDQVSVTEYEAERKRQLQCSETLPWECRTRLSAQCRQKMLLEAGVSFQCIQQRIHRIKIKNNLALRSRLLASHKQRGNKPRAPRQSM